MTPLRILLILEATLGGTARHCLDLARGLRHAGHEVHLIYNPLRMDHIFRDGLPSVTEIGVIAESVPMQRSVGFHDLRSARHIRSYIRRNGPFSIIHGHSSKGGALARIAPVGLPGKRFYTPNAFVTTDPKLPPLQRSVYRLLERVLALCGHHVIAVSQEEYDHALELGVQRHCLSLVPNGIDLTSPRPRTYVRSEFGLAEQDVVVGFVGRLVPQKSPGNLLTAFSIAAHKHPHLQLAIVGAGELLPELRSMAASLHIQSQVHWLGVLDGLAAMELFDVFVLPSDYEGLPYVLLEAMASGLPVVSTAVGGARTLIADGVNGFVVPAGDPQALGDAIVRLVGTAGLMAKMAAASRERARYFSSERMVADVLRAYYAEVAKPVG